MKILKNPYYGIYFGDKFYKKLKKKKKSIKIILVDSLTKKYCLHYFLYKTDFFKKKKNYKNLLRREKKKY